MITAEEVDVVLDKLEAQELEMPVFYQGIAATHPMAFAWIMSESAPLTEEEHDYFLFLAMVIMLLALLKEKSDCDPEKLESTEEEIWTILNDDMPHSLAVQAENVDDENAAVIFLVDSLHANEELPFLTPTGALAMYARLYALITVLGLGA